MANQSGIVPFLYNFPSFHLPFHFIVGHAYLFLFEHKRIFDFCTFFRKIYFALDGKIVVVYLGTNGTSRFLEVCFSYLCLFRFDCKCQEYQIVQLPLDWGKFRFNFPSVWLQRSNNSGVLLWLPLVTASLIPLFCISVSLTYFCHSPIRFNG